MLWVSRFPNLKISNYFENIHLNKVTSILRAPNPGHQAKPEELRGGPVLWTGLRFLNVSIVIDTIKNYKMFYKKGQKVISLDIEKYITPLALAVLIMDDGGGVGLNLELE